MRSLNPNLAKVIVQQNVQSKFFNENNKQYCKIERIICVEDAISNPLRISVNPSQHFLVSYSVDGVCFTPFFEYEKYQELIGNLGNGIGSDVYVRVKIWDALHELRINTIKIDRYSVQSPPMQNQEIPCDPQFNPYAMLDCAILLQQQLADHIVCSLGIPIYYFRCEPRQDSKDFTFKEFQLHDVVDVKQIKMMLTDGQLPTSNHKVSSFDFEWESDWDTELSKTQFAQAFGDEKIPKHKDFIYVPMMKRMWEVNSAYDERKEGLMWRSTTWKITLTKYVHSADVVKNDDFSSIIDNFIDIFDQNNEVFEKEFEQQNNDSAWDQVRSPGNMPESIYKISPTNPLTNNSTNLPNTNKKLVNVFRTDGIRHSLTLDSVKIEDQILCHYNNIVCRNAYRFLNDESLIVYQNRFENKETKSGTIQLIFDTNQLLDLKPGTSKPILTIGKDMIPLEIYRENVGKQGNDGRIIIGNSFINLPLLAGISVGDTCMLVLSWDFNNKYTILRLYKQRSPLDRPKYAIREESKFFDMVKEEIRGFNEDYVIDSEDKNGNGLIQLMGYPLGIRKLTIFNNSLDNLSGDGDGILYSYVPKTPSLILNDVCRPITTNQVGYTLR